MPADAEFPDAIVVPGFVDMHVHGGGGASFADGNAADIARAAEFHLRHGSARNRSSWFGSAAAGPSCRIAAPISTTKAAPRAPAWLAMPVNMMGFPFC